MEKIMHTISLRNLTKEESPKYLTKDKYTAEYKWTDALNEAEMFTSKQHAEDVFAELLRKRKEDANTYSENQVSHSLINEGLCLEKANIFGKGLVSIEELKLFPKRTEIIQAATIPSYGNRRIRALTPLKERRYNREQNQQAND